MRPAIPLPVLVALVVLAGTLGGPRALHWLQKRASHASLAGDARHQEPLSRKTPPQLMRMFDPTRAMAHVAFLAGEIGPRPAGSEAEQRAADYAAAQLSGWGWDVHRQEGISIRGRGRVTQNVLGTHPTDSGSGIVIVGAHMDSCTVSEQSPGANDNASGVAVVLELGRVMRHSELPYRLQLVLFGAEERTRRGSALHHVGSDAFVANMKDGERARVLAMLSVDMVGAGPKLVASRVGYGSDSARQALLSSADRLGLAMDIDTGRAWSDHEAFELAGIPAVWLTRMGSDPRWHTARDRPEYIGEQALNEAGRLCVRFLTLLAERDGEEPPAMDCQGAFHHSLDVLEPPFTDHSS